MHELSIASSAYRTSREAAQANGGSRLQVVRMAVGELSSVEPALLASAWEAVTSGGPDARSRLEVSFVPARQTCPACGPAERPPGSWLPACPRCEGALRIEGGNELHVIDVTIEVDDS